MPVNSRGCVYLTQLVRIFPQRLGAGSQIQLNDWTSEMADDVAARPAKQLKTHGQPFLQEVRMSAAADDSASVTTSSSSSSESATPDRQTRLPLRSMIAAEEDSSSSGEEEHSDKETETTSSSDSDDSDNSDDSDEGVSEDNGSSPAATSTHIPPEAAPIMAPSLAARVQSFLPQLQQANREMTASKESQIDNVTDEAKHYIEMDLSLGVLAEEQSDDEEIKIPQGMTEREKDSEDGLEGQMTMSMEMHTRKTTKRKIEEVG
jgi:hypothetical protein